MLDIAVSCNRYKFIGFEFLTWLWFVMERMPDVTGGPQGVAGHLEVGNRIALENRTREGQMEHVVIQGDAAGLEEALLSLKKGAMVSEINLLYRLDGRSWQFTLKGESFHLTNIKLPEKKPVNQTARPEDIVLEKADLLEAIFEVLDRLYFKFITLRISEDWGKKILPQMRKWTGETNA